VGLGALVGSGATVGLGGLIGSGAAEISGGGIASSGCCGPVCAEVGCWVGGVRAVVGVDAVPPRDGTDVGCGVAEMRAVARGVGDRAESEAWDALSGSGFWGCDCGLDCSSADGGVGISVDACTSRGCSIGVSGGSLAPKFCVGTILRGSGGASTMATAP